jgi:WD40 repeat protein
MSTPPRPVSFDSWSRGHGAYVSAVSWSPDSQRLATASADGTSKIGAVTDGAGGLLVTTLTAEDVRSGFDDVDFSAAGRRLITGSRSGVTAAWDVGLSAGTEVATLPAAVFVYNAAQFDRVGHLYTTSAGGQVGMWDADTWERVRTLGRPPDTLPAPSAIVDVPIGSTQDVMRDRAEPRRGIGRRHFRRVDDRTRTGRSGAGQ